MTKVGILEKRAATPYIDILTVEIPKYAEKLDVSASEVIFQQNKDPRHMLKAIKMGFKNNDITMLEWPQQSPDLNSTRLLERREVRKSCRQKCVLHGKRFSQMCAVIFLIVCQEELRLY